MKNRRSLHVSTGRSCLLVGTCLSSGKARIRTEPSRGQQSLTLEREGFLTPFKRCASANANTLHFLCMPVRVGNLARVPQKAEPGAKTYLLLVYRTAQSLRARTGKGVRRSCCQHEDDPFCRTHCSKTRINFISRQSLQGKG